MEKYARPYSSRLQSECNRDGSCSTLKHFWSLLLVCSHRPTPTGFASQDAHSAALFIFIYALRPLVLLHHTSLTADQLCLAIWMLSLAWGNWLGHPRSCFLPQGPRTSMPMAPVWLPHSLGCSGPESRFCVDTLCGGNPGTHNHLQPQLCSLFNKAR